MDIVGITVAGIVLSAGALALADRIIKPRLWVRLAVLFAYLFAMFLGAMLAFADNPSVLPSIAISALAAVGGTLLIAAEQWLHGKIIQGAVDRANAFSRKGRGPGQFY